MLSISIIAALHVQSAVLRGCSNCRILHYTMQQPCAKCQLSSIQDDTTWIDVSSRLFINHCKSAALFSILTIIVPIHCQRITRQIWNWNGPIQVEESLEMFTYVLSFRLDLFADGNDFSWTTIQKGRNKYHQKQLAETINRQTAETMSLLTNTLKIHLNQGQHWQMNTSSVFLSTESLSAGSITNKIIEPIKDVRMRLPPNLIFNTTDNDALLIRVCSLWSFPLTECWSTLCRQRYIPWLRRTLVNWNRIQISRDRFPWRFLIIKDERFLCKARRVTELNWWSLVTGIWLFLRCLCRMSLPAIS